MKKILPICIILIFYTALCIGQTKHVPGNIKQAISSLSIECSDSLKTIIKNTDDNDLKALCYPWGGEFRTIFEWTRVANDNSKIVKYFRKNGISYHYETIILKAFKQYLLGVTIDEKSILKPYQEIENKWAAEDEIRSTTDSLRGVYIPKDLEDCFSQIDSFWPDSIKDRVRQWTENEFLGRLHLGFGMWMRNNWQLWGGSRLSKYFNELEIYHPDDMSGIILDSYHRYLNKKELKLDDQIQGYKDYWLKNEKEAVESKQQEFAEYNLGDTVLFSYSFGYSTPEQEKKFDEDICLAKGKIMEKDDGKFLLKIRLIESCDRKGIIYYDNDNAQIYNKKTKKWEKPKKRIIKRMKNGQENWFNYSDWETNE